MGAAGGTRRAEGAGEGCAGPRRSVVDPAAPGRAEQIPARVLVKRTVSSVLFRNMSSNTSDHRPDTARSARRVPGTPAGGSGPPGPPAEGATDKFKPTDAWAMRALAHPVRLALLEALVHAGTLTATQASELIGESPANCAFHLRTLAKYGYVVEAGGGRARRHPDRRPGPGGGWAGARRLGPPPQGGGQGRARRGGGGGEGPGAAVAAGPCRAAYHHRAGGSRRRAGGRGARPVLAGHDPGAG